MIVAQNSNFKAKHVSVDQREPFGNGPLLLKPTGVPVFTPVSTAKQVARDFIVGTVDGGSTIDTMAATQVEERTVRAKSFVIGRKIENQTGINLIDLESMTLPSEKQFPVKVLYEKRSHEHKSYLNNDRKGEKQEIKAQTVQKIENNKENHTLNAANLKMLNQVPKVLPLQKDFPKQSAVSNAQKTKELKHRPKSATTQQIKKDAIKHSKLGPNTQIKPQISYVKKVQSQQRPQTAKIDKARDEKSQGRQTAKKPDREESPTRTDIPFTQNRFQGQFGNITKDLIKKAQEALKEEKLKAQKEKEEQQQKKEKLKQIAEEVKKQNQDQVIKQKEKGTERVDLRQKEEEKKQQERKKELLEEKKRKEELRKKRKEETRKQLGLELFDEAKVEEYRKKVKDSMKELEEKAQATQKVNIDHLKVAQDKKEKPQLLLMMNRDFKEAIKEEQAYGEDNEMDEEQKKLERKRILKEQKIRRKQLLLEQQQKAEEEKRKKAEALEQLQLQIKLKAEEDRKKQELKIKIQEEKEKIQRELEELQQQEQKRAKKKKKQKPSHSHKEQFNELRDWIDEQLQKGEEQLDKVNESVVEQPSKIDIKIVPKQQSQQLSVNNSMVAETLQLQKKVKPQQKAKSSSQGPARVPFNNERILQMKSELPGNSDIYVMDDQKFGVRDNRYGIFGDNGYNDLIEIKRREINPDPIQDNIGKDELRLSKEGLVQIISKIQDYHLNKERQLKEAVIEEIKAQEQQRKIINEPQPEVIAQSKQTVPGVVDVEREIRKQMEEKRQKEVGATVVIQKWARGFFARQQVREMREEKRSRIEAEYGYFEDQVKFNTDYNLQKFLKEKQKLREANKTTQIHESSSIQEKIGESSQSQSKSLRGKSAPQTNPQVQNFFREKSDKDPLSLIEIFAKRHAPKVVPSVVKSPIRPENQRRHIRSQDSDIEEEIYSESFEDEENKSQKTGGTIEEDIIEGSKGMSSTSHKDSARQKKPFNYKQSASIIEDSIQEDYIQSMGRRSIRSPDKRDDSSIAEESQLHQQMSISKSSAQKKGIMIEESIQEEYEGQGFDSYSGSAGKFSRVQMEKQRQEAHKKQVQEFENKMKEDEAKRKRLVNELLDEMKRYEQASVSTVVVERVEKVITQSLAQKDRLLMGQRLHELELQRTHQQEINKIREEQIKLMSLLMLQGGVAQGSQSDADKERILEEIRKIIDKPVVIKQEVIPVQQPRKQPQIKVDPSDSDRDYEEQYDNDFIEESKGLSRLGKNDDDDDSIKESIHNGDDESIAEEILEGSRDDSDDIKESIRVDGKKLNESKSKKTGDKELPKMRYALGSEESLRQESKKALKKSQNNDLKGSGVFDKHSFQDFTSKKFKELLFDEKARNNFMKEIELEIEKKRIKDEEKLHKDYKKNLISPRTFRKRSQELEKWVTNKKTELHKNKLNMMQTVEEMNTYLEKLEHDKKSMLEKIGSPRVPKRLTDSVSSVDYDEIEEESNESLRIRKARDQLRDLARSLDQDDPEAREIEKKRLVAKKLIKEKEKAIEEGLKQRLKEIEGQQADQMLNLALNLDINKEIERRINGAMQALVEESSKFDEYSARGSVSQSMGVQSEDPKKKKNVKFASPERFSSAHSIDQSSGGASSSKYRSSHRIEDSIGESIKIEESYQMSQGTNQISGSLKKSHSKDKIQESIKESIPEQMNDDSIHEDDYPEDFEQSMGSVKSEQNALIMSRNQLMQKANTLQDQEDDVEYSMNFDESIGQSQQLSNFQQPQKQPPQQTVEQVDEESEEEDPDQQLKSQDSKVKDSEDVPEEEVGSESIATSSKLVDSSAVDIQEEDKEILQSVRSVEWVINLDQPVESQRSVKKSDDERYSEDFEEIDDEVKEDIYDKDQSKQIDELEDLESYPEDESVDDFELRADKITDEFMALLMEEIKGNKDLNLQTNIDVEEFKDKFPFNLIEEKNQPELVKKQVKPDQVAPKPEEEKKIETPKKPEVKEDLVRAKYEQETKKQQDQMKDMEKYLDQMIQNIKKQDLIKQLEKPFDVDPLKKLAQIFSQDNVEESFNQVNESHASQTILSLDFFIKMEDLFARGKQHDTQNLTESDRQSLLKSENIHHKAIFDAFNQALDIERPYKDKGNPPPWSKQTRVVRPKITEKQVETMLQKAKERVMTWSKTNAGTRIAPLPPPPPVSNDYDNQAQQQPQTTEEERINQAREEKLGVLMMRELEENENKLIDYEDEDTQVKFDLADMVLEELAGELATLMMELGNRRV